MLVYVRIERLDAVKQSVYHGLYEDEHVDAAEAAKYASFFKVCCGWAVVAVICLGLVYFVLAFALNMRLVNGAKVVRVWWRMSMLAMSMDVILIEPIVLGLYCVVFPATLSPALSKHGGDPAREVDFPFRTAIVDRPSAVMLLKDRVATRAGKGCDVGQLRAAPLSVVFHSFRLIFRRAIISRNGLEA